MATDCNEVVSLLCTVLPGPKMFIRRYANAPNAANFQHGYAAPVIYYTEKLA